MPCEKYRLGTQSHALREFFSAIKIFFNAPVEKPAAGEKSNLGSTRGKSKRPSRKGKTFLRFLCGPTAPQSARDHRNRRLSQRPRHPARRAPWPRGTHAAFRPDPEFFQVGAGRLHRFLRTAAGL